ncbi:MAG TPA: rhomboid family intramembrane serine protease [Oceanobacillus sp.]|nr:rhomboid family intramembrane serine protease [Oceanobacillus sp.]
MLPVSTFNNPTRRTPYLTYGLILTNILVFLWELSLPTRELYNVFYNAAVVPCQLNLFSLETPLDIFRSMFLHGSWAHLGSNMLFLWIFGSNVEDYFGRRAFIAMYLITGAVAALTQTLVHTGVCVPMIGASGAISGVLGAFLVLYPAVKVRVAAIFFKFFMRTFVLPAFLVLGYWFIVQLFAGIASLGVDTLSDGGGVAVFAHIGGFIAGALIAFVATMFKPVPPAYDAV